MADALERKIAARRVVIEQCDAEFCEIADMLGGPFEIECTEERTSLLREVLAKYRAAINAAWNGA